MNTMYCIVLRNRRYGMDVQLKKGLLEICVLTAIEAEESYGYKIISDLSSVVEISESTLYPILKRLESAGALTTYSQEFNGRLRKYYLITREGRRRLAEFKTGVPQMEKIMGFILKRRA